MSHNRTLVAIISHRSESFFNKNPLIYYFSKDVSTGSKIGNAKSCSRLSNRIFTSTASTSPDPLSIEHVPCKKVQPNDLLVRKLFSSHFIEMAT